MNFRSFRRLSAFCLLAGTCASIPAFAANGTLYFSRDSDGSGLNSLDTVTGAATHLGVSGVTGATVGLTEGPNPGILYGSTFAQLAHINADGSGFTTAGPIGVEGLAYDPNSGILYGAINGAFNAYDPSDGQMTANLTDPNVDVEGLAYGRGGVYGLAENDNLYFYTIGTDTWSLVGNSGVDFDNAGLAYDPIGDILYAKGRFTGMLYSMNPTTGVAFPIGDTGLSGGGGLAFVPNDVTQVPEASTVLGGGSLAALLLVRALRARTSRS